MSGVRAATGQDVDAWLSLADEVEPLFGPMPHLRRAVERGIDRGTALVTGDKASITGGMLLSRDDQKHQILWLAVRTSARGQDRGAALVQAALDHWPDGDIDVTTFVEGQAGGLPARRLYERFGFELIGTAPPAPDGSPRDLYRLHR